eukprot:4042400-Prymnesium_polylepis.1
MQPLPAWPMRVACKGLDRDFGVRLSGSARDVKYSLRLGALEVAVDWDNTTGNGVNLTAAQIRDSGVLELAVAVVGAANV